ncbi:MAG: hypothetical protein AAFQ65_12165 [Myxococcota bacterium]
MLNILKPSSLGLFVGCGLVFALQGCGGEECGDDTVERDGVCVASVSCGQGTQLRDGECRPVATGPITCGEGTMLNADGDACEPNSEACENPADFDVMTGRCAAEGTISCGPGTEAVSGQCRPSCSGAFELQNAARDGCLPAIRVQFVNALPDPARLSLDVVFESTIGETPDEGEVAAEDLAFGSATDVLKLPSDAVVSLRDESGAAVTASVDPLDANPSVLAVIRPASDGGAAAVSSVVVDAVTLRESVETAGEVELAFVHAALEAGAIALGQQVDFDTVPRPELRLVDNLAFGAASAYVSTTNTILEAGRTVAFDLFAGGGNQGNARETLASFQTSAGEVVTATSGPGGDTVAVLVAVGFFTPPNEMTPGFDFIWVSPDGSTAPVDRATRFQLVHAGAPPNNVDVDIFALRNGADAFEPALAQGLSYQEAEPFQTLPSGVPLSVRVFAASASEPAVDDTTVATLSFDEGLPAGRQRLVALTDASDGTSLTVAVAEAGPRSVGGAGFGADFFHAAPGVAAEVDAHINSIGGNNFAEAEVSGLTYASGQSVATDSAAIATFEDKTVGFTTPGGTQESDLVAEFNLTFSVSSPVGAGDGLFFVLADNPVAAVEDLLLFNVRGERLVFN